MWYIYRLFRAHPTILTKIPKLANVPIASLETNPDLIAYGKMVMVGLDLIEHIDDADHATRIMDGKPYKSFFLPDIPISLQLEV